MILVVEDEVVITDWMRDVVHQAGYYFDSAIDGPSALYKLSRLEYGLALLDIHLPPPVKGDRLARMIRTLPEPYGSIPLIAMTGGDFQDVTPHLFRDVLRKPFKSSALLTMIRQYARPPIRDLHHTQAIAGQFSSVKE